MTDDNDSAGVSSRAEEFMQVFKKGAEFTQNLLKENENLRYRVLELEQSLRDEGPVAELQLLEKKLQIAEAEKREILDRISSIERRSLDFAGNYAEIEAENNLLANLYITTYQLHSTFDANEIVRVIEEILLNLVGVAQFSLLLRDENDQMLQPFLDESGETRIEEVEINDARIEQVLAGGQQWLASAEELTKLDKSEVKAVIPLQVNNEVIGVLAIYRLLEQKSAFTEMDEEVFNLLGAHAAMAICTAMLRNNNVGRVSFKQGFLSNA